MNDALIIVDVQNDFCHADGVLAQAGHDTTMMAAVVEPVLALRAAARAAGVPVIFTRVEHSDWTDDDAWRARFDGLPAAGLRSPIVAKGSWGAGFFSVEPGDNELVLVKHRHSAFGYTPLPLVLRARRIERLVIAGVQTDVCVQQTAVDAIQHGVRAAVVSDAVGTLSRVAHDAALAGIAARVGPMFTAADVLRGWHVSG